MASNDLWNWLAGLLDGEGCFVLMRNSAGTINARVTIDMRADDWRTLATIKEQTTLGRLSFREARPTKNAMVVWECLRIGDCAELVKNLRGRMRSKKAGDFALWAEAVEILLRTGGGGSSEGYGRLTVIKDDLALIKRYAETQVAEARTLFRAGRLEGGGYAKRSKWSYTQKLPADEILAEYRGGGVSQKTLGIKYGVSVMVINRIVNGQYRLGTA